MLKSGKLYIALICTALLMSGCAQDSQAKGNEAAATPEMTGETADATEEKTEDIKEDSEADSNQTQTEPAKKNYEITADGIDYLDVSGIEVEPGVTIAMVGKDSKSSYWSKVKSGAAQAIADLNQAMGYSGKKKIKLSYDAPAGEDVIEQINIIDQFLDKSPDALCIGFVDASSCQTQTELAMNNGVSLIAVDSADDANNMESFCATDSYQAAREAAARLFDAVGENSQVAVIVHNEITQTGIDRKNGIIDELTENYNDKGIQIVDIIYVKQDDRTEAEFLDEVLEKNPELSGVISTNLNTTEALVDYMAGMEAPSFQAVGFDYSDKILTAVENGSLLGTIAQNPYGMGYATVVAAARSVAEMENAVKVTVDYTWVNAENVKSEDVQAVINQ